MNFAINETTTDDIALKTGSHVLHTYAYLFVGILVTLVSILPAFPLVRMRKEFRDHYTILAVAFFNSELAGISAILLGIKRTIISAGVERFINHCGCVLNVPTLLLMSYLLNGTSLLMNSVERLCVVTFPLYYYIHSRRISYSLIAVQYVITIIMIASTVVASLIEPTRRISNFCWLQHVFSPPFFVASLLLTYIVSLLSVVLMIIAVIILRKKFGSQFLSNHSCNRNLTQFLKNQKRYTQTSLISCCFTFFFVVLPSIAEQINRMKTSVVSEIIVMCCVYLRLLNSCNLVIVFLYRQRDLRHAAMRYIKDQFCGRKDYIVLFHFFIPMEPAINETTIEDNIVVNNTNNILHIYAYLFVGTLITLVNIPVFPLVIMRKALRGPFAVLLVTFFNSEFTGISAVLLGVKRTIVSFRGERLISHHECVLNVPTLLLMSYLLNGTSLLMNSVERLCVVTFPLYYYIHSRRISYSLIAVQYVITIIMIASTVVASLIEPTRRISNFCWLQHVFSPPFSVASLLLTYIVSLLSVVLMIIAVVILRKKFGSQFLSNHSCNRNLTQFLKNQKRYTQTSLISCCFTFFFVVLPSIAEQINRMKTSVVPQITLMCCVYLRLLNSCNLVIIFLYRQRDLRHAAMRCLKNQFCGRKNHVKPIKTIGFGK
uniref:G_PROTEIN_RECEP_F1_2 domain-containing protein n=1 Tax=Onchocerca volvulus TaxID=6282 RepID=A0A2K6VDK4_ONCVO